MCRMMIYINWGSLERAINTKSHKITNQRLPVFATPLAWGVVAEGLACRFLDLWVAGSNSGSATFSIAQ